MNILNDEKLLQFKYENDLNQLRKYKWLHYTGKLSEEQLKELDWEPFELSILKQDIDKFMSADDDIIELKSKLEFQRRKVDYLESIIKMINNRQWLIREAIDWIKFTNGV